MKRYLLFCMVFFLTAALVSAQSARKYFKVGEEFYKVRKYEDAIAQFTSAIELDPDFDDAYVQRALSYEKLDRYAEAAEDYERALVFLEKDVEVTYLAGRAYYNSGDLDYALVKLNKAIGLKSNYLAAYQERIRVFIDLERYDAALEDCKRALRIKEDEKSLYYLGLVYEKLEMFPEAEQAYIKSINKNKNVVDSHLALAQLSFNREKYDLAMSSVNQVLRINSRHKEGLMLRSSIHARQFNIVKAIDDISVALNIFQGDPDLYALRGEFYQQLNRHSDAVNDFTNTLEADPGRAEIYYQRANSYEAQRDFESAMKDYETLLEMSEYDGNAQRLYAQAQERMFELNREDDKPVISLLDPLAEDDKTVNIPRGLDVIPLTGKIHDASEIVSLVVNDFTVQPTKKGDSYEFLASINLRNSDQITIEVRDVYENNETAIYNVIRTETDAPTVSIVAPYASDSREIYLDSDDPVIFLEGKVIDESRIKSIYIDDVAASYVPTDIEPMFAARVSVANRSKFTVRVEDIYGNVANVDFTLNRDASDFADNPMGKTWVVFVENSNYEYFAALEGPTKDVTLMRQALAGYQINNFLHKQNMTKDEMERFFSIELRDLLKRNHVSSILVWYAGHGKFMNETGYWIPVDAKRDDEFSYYTVNKLKAAMQSYPDFVTHTLVVTDACESGPTFYQAMRSANTEVRSCDDWQATRFKSSQVLSSAGYELAVDDSQFTRTFANTLRNNPGACIPIESIVQKVSSAVESNNQQKPQFGKIDGLEDENGTFFFMPIDY